MSIQDLQLDYEPTFIMVGWVFSIVIVFFYIWLHLRFYFVVKDEFMKGHILSHILQMSLLLIAEFIITLSTLSHLGFMHGWNVHIVNEKLCIGYLVFAVFNIVFSDHLYEEVQNG